MLDEWVVVEYDAVDVRTYQSEESKTVPGSPSGATVVSARSEDAAIRSLARSGHFTAFKIPVRPTRQVMLELVDRA